MQVFHDNGPFLCFYRRTPALGELTDITVFVTSLRDSFWKENWTQTTQETYLMKVLFQHFKTSVYPFPWTIERKSVLQWWRNQAEVVIDKSISSVLSLKASTMTSPWHAEVPHFMSQRSFRPFKTSGVNSWEDIMDFEVVHVMILSHFPQHKDRTKTPPLV